MRIAKTLPPPPHFDMKVLEDRSSKAPGFLRYMSHRLAIVNSDEQLGDDFIYDRIDREALDAVVVVPHFVDQESGTRYVVLRSAARPPVVLREAARSPIQESDNRALWEVPAGLVEADEQSETGLRDAALREMLEEVGFSPEHRIEALGPPTFPAPGMIAERHFYFHAPVDPATQVEPSLDGSPLEAAGEVIAVPLSAALSAARAGGLQDAKTELALRRLMEHLEEADS